MAQGSAKLGKVQKSAGGTKRKATKQLLKGRKTYKPKGRKADENKPILATSKEIEKKNEAIVSAKAISAGSRFFLNDVKAVGKQELSKQHKIRNKKEEHEKKLTERLKDQLRKLGREV